MYSFSPHLSDELLRIFIWQKLVIFWKIIYNIKIFFFSEQVTHLQALILTDTRLNHSIAFIVNDAFKFFRTHTQQVTNLVRKALKIPDVHYRYYQFDVPHSLTSHFLFCYFHTTTVAYNTFVADAFVLTTGAFIILHRPENSFTKQTIALRLIGAIVDC